ncbi:Transcriptional regulatory protein pro1 [Cladobotryum mycophilum]|uniref:Transcriptional regulatory protein pro1 n=1 Tax=Cladobotryum mycophilum TaxID=491253 RepID=A0ABR0SE83_9HYPO
MAVAQSVKAKTAPKSNNGNSKTKTQMHRRSRTGCYTCRLRRKKCDEGSPLCTACKHLGLVCEYKRPMWWSNNDARRKHKEDIKGIIKRKKLSEKSAHTMSTSVGSSPPGLTHSISTSSTYTDALDRNRSDSIDSHFSAPFNFNSPPPAHYAYNGQFPRSS